MLHIALTVATAALAAALTTAALTVATAALTAALTTAALTIATAALSMNGPYLDE